MEAPYLCKQGTVEMLKLKVEIFVPYSRFCSIVSDEIYVHTRTFKHASDMIFVEKVCVEV